jgi:hypothetical protein
MMTSGRKPFIFVGIARKPVALSLVASRVTIVPPFAFAAFSNSWVSRGL